MKTLSMKFSTVFALSVLSMLMVSPVSEAYDETRNLFLDQVGIRVLEINTGDGNVTVEAAKKSLLVEVQAKIIVGDARENRAKLHLKNNVTVTLKLEGDVARLVCKAADELYEGGFLDRDAKTRFHLDIKVPQHIAIVITNQSGSVKVKNVQRNVSVQSGRGDLTVSDIVGNLDVQTDKGKAEISDIRGDIVVRDGAENVVVRNVKGKVDVANKSGNVDIADVDGNVHISDGSGNVTLNKIKGDVVIPSAAKGKVVLERIDGSVKIN